MHKTRPGVTLNCLLCLLRTELSLEESSLPSFTFTPSSDIVDIRNVYNNKQTLSDLPPVDDVPSVRKNTRIAAKITSQNRAITACQDKRWMYELVSCPKSDMRVGYSSYLSVESVNNLRIYLWATWETIRAGRDLVTFVTQIRSGNI